ncbi:MAG: bifunctional hydroxymethylpyrimidine kinase/phosphomethylpyrimidine kinase [Candidatus Sumerlaeales bacterium]|nr:bifunctional hydroxymethylpyrimidine kinase/phosphomethylpyrimidine kinase [Candidatus Sumerlaeales bacterium]
MLKRVLTIAGSDSGGGAGIQADLKTFSALGTFGMSVITAITAQNTLGVTGVEDVSTEMVAKQMDAIFSDLRPDAVKIGMVSSSAIIRIIANKLDEYHVVDNVVIDPVMVSKSGCNLMHPESRDTLIRCLLPHATVLTPNLPEAEVLTEMTLKTVDDMKIAAQRLCAMGPRCVVIKGGHRLDSGSAAVDLMYDGESFAEFSSKRFETSNTHGTGCTFSSAIASWLARGLSPAAAIENAKQYVSKAIENSLAIGGGVGSTHHFWAFYDRDNGMPIKR